MFRFTIRDVLWLTMVVALALAWWVDRRSLNRTNRSWKLRATAAAQVMRQTGWTVTWKDNGGATYDGHGQRLDVGF